MSSEKRFSVRTFGCQMNIHDSEKLSNLLFHAGHQQAVDEADADLLVINTCSIREKAENKLYSELGLLRSWKEERSGRLVGVGGCVAQQEGETILRRFPHVDFVFGTHNLRAVPAMLAGAQEGVRSLRVEESRSQERFDLPERHPSLRDRDSGQAFLTVMEGCDMFCSFCVVPTTRGREISRPAGSILEEAAQRVDAGIREITLLGQTVNAYGRHDLRRATRTPVETIPFAELLESLDALPGLERIRYTSPHPLFFDDALIRAHGRLESLCPHVHLPVQSGSNRVLEEMRRRYSRETFLETVRRLRVERPDIVLTTDLIVAFPGESESEFQETLDLVEEAGFVDSYCFKYSPRPGTRALELGEEIPAEVAQERLRRLQDLQHRLTLEYHFSRVGGTAEILVEGASRRGNEQICGRDLYHRVVNVPIGESGAPSPGELLRVDVVDGTPHSLIGAIPMQDNLATL